MINFKELIRIYSINTSITETYGDSWLELNNILQELPKEDIAILYLYMDCGSYMKTAKILGVSYCTARKLIIEIREKILSKVPKNLHRRLKEDIDNAD